MPDLTGMPALDLAIGLSFIYLMLSLACSAAQEALAAVFGLRARTLEAGLREMLLHGKTPREEADLVAKLYAHPLLRGGARGRRRWLPWRGRDPEHLRLPSYISPRSFSVALLDTLTSHEGDDSEDLDARLEAGLARYPLPDTVRTMLRRRTKAVDGDLDALTGVMESWFDDTMARVSGWYKRETQIIVTVLAILLTLALNANSITIGERLWRDPGVRAAIVAQSAKASQVPAGADAQSRLRSAASDVDHLQELGVPIGWTSDPKDPRHLGAVWTVVGGWIITMLAVSLGAPFWFDALGKLARLRASGQPETPAPAAAREVRLEGPAAKRFRTKPTE